MGKNGPHAKEWKVKISFEELREDGSMSSHGDVCFGQANCLEASGRDTRISSTQLQALVKSPGLQRASPEARLRYAATLKAKVSSG